MLTMIEINNPIAEIRILMISKGFVSINNIENK